MEFFNQAPSSWSFANKMMILLLERADFWGENGIRPHSLKVTTISALMGGLSKEKRILRNWRPSGTIGKSRPKTWGSLFAKFSSDATFCPEFRPGNRLSKNRNADGLNSNIPDFAENLTGIANL